MALIGMVWLGGTPSIVLGAADNQPSGSQDEITVRKESRPAVTERRHLPISPQELDKFLVDWPRLIDFSRERGEEFRSPAAKSEGFDDIFTRQATDFIRAMGWNPARFNYVLERISSLLAGLEMRDRGAKVRAVLRAERIEAENNPDLSRDQRLDRLAELAAHERSLAENLALLEKAAPVEVNLIEANRHRIMKALKSLYR